MSRSAVYSLVSAACPGVKVYGSYAADTPTEPQYIILIWGTETKAFGVVGDRILDVWVYDIDRDFTAIDQMHRAIRKALTDAVHASGEDGDLAAATWQGEGVDAYDPTYDRIVRNATYSTITSTAV